MNKNLKVFYCSPYTSKVATIRTILDSARGQVKHSKEEVQSKIIDVAKGGFLFNTNSSKYFSIIINKFKNCDKEIFKNIIHKTKKNIKGFSIFSQHINLKKIMF